MLNYKPFVCTYCTIPVIFTIPNKTLFNMTGTLSIRDIITQYLSKFSVTKTGADQTIHFSFADIYANQRQIVALWRELNHMDMKPTAKTFLGKIISIKVNPK